MCTHRELNKFTDNVSENDLTLISKITKKNLKASNFQENDEKPRIFFNGFIDCLINFLIFYTREILDSSITKDNPAFSMINDSDEEVIYGSDEDSRRPLTRVQRNTDDSDWE